MTSFRPIYYLQITFIILYSFSFCGNVMAMSEELKPYYKVMEYSESRDLVLHHMRAGTAAFEVGDHSLAKQSFDFVLNQIELIYVNDKNGNEARSLWYSEGRKDFKGEPYERSMAYYYRGLLYIIDGDYENARASFEGGILQDAFAEEKQNRCDFASLYFLSGWASQQLGDKDLAEESYKQVKLFKPNFKKPKADNNVLVIIESGKSPRKISDGVGHYELKFRRGKRFNENKVQIQIADTTHHLFEIEDVYWQAISRGGRPVDKIIKGKLVFKRNMESMGTTLNEIGTTAAVMAPLTNSGSMAGIGSAIGLFGGIQTLIAANADARADTRYWNNLPDKLHITTIKSDKAVLPQVSVNYLDKNSTQVNSLNKIAINHTDKKGGALVWARSRSALVKIPKVKHKKEVKNEKENTGFNNNSNDDGFSSLYND